ncbi:MAG: hypothetical protein ACRDPC_20035, partial [Solirubrobacteraceae bacterium]
ASRPTGAGTDAKADVVAGRLSRGQVADRLTNSPQTPKREDLTSNSAWLFDSPGFRPVFDRGPLGTCHVDAVPKPR